jgi:putative acetyltransferase
MAVKSQFQSQGTGSRLVEEGLRRCAENQYDAVVVLGHPQYYPRFGFVPSADFGIQSEYDVPKEVFMILELVPGCLTGHTGVIEFHPLFNTI